MSILPIISVILPSYNRVKFLSQTIESCLTQTFENFELIIVDDCSSDNSLEVAKSYAKNDKRIQVIQNAKNRKLPATLNIGFKAARGEYFTWISDDNLFYPNALEKMYNFLNTMPKIGLVYADYILINYEGKLGKRIYQEPPEFLPIRDCVGVCFLYRANIAKQVGQYNEDMIFVEDYEYWLRLGLITKFYHIKEPLYFYRIHSGSLTSKHKEECRKAKISLKKIYFPQYKILRELQPISDLYEWFIGDKNFRSYLKLLSIIFSHPMITLTYILKNLRRL